MAEAKLDAVGCGSMVVDRFYRTPRIIGAEEKILLDTHRAGEVERIQVGGVTLNHLGWARVLGLEVGIFGKLGDDQNGAVLRAGMDRLGIQHHLTLDGSASAFANIFVDRAGGRAIYMARGATGELEPGEVRRCHGTFIRRAHLVSTEVSQLPLATVLAILRYARAHSITTVLDVDIPPSDACAILGTRGELERALKLATILKPAKAAARELVGDRALKTNAHTMDALEMAETIRAHYGSRAVVITDGERGCAIAADRVALRVPAFRARPLDTTGAGDAFLGAMLAGLRWNLPWASIGRLANAAGAVCVGRLGAFPSGFEVRDAIAKRYGEALPAPAPAARPTAISAIARLDPGEEIDRFFALCLDELGELQRVRDSRALMKAVAMIRATDARGGRIHVTGVGKPEHVARYAASLFCSIGTPATFLHATEALHGSLGQVHPHDLVIAISNSGNTAEICATASAIKEHGAELIAITGNARSPLARMANFVLPCPVRREGGVLGLAPRISVLGEVYLIAALSVGLEAARGLTAEEYGQWHRAGTLGAAARRIARSRSS
jgi:sugar/nucleoside kinase (ribokinase family)/D-arabinose 5-phosphate isomerase GutQ